MWSLGDEALSDHHHARSRGCSEPSHWWITIPEFTWWNNNKNKKRNHRIFFLRSRLNSKFRIPTLARNFNQTYDPSIHPSALDHKKKKKDRRTSGRWSPFLRRFKCQNGKKKKSTDRFKSHKTANEIHDSMQIIDNKIKKEANPNEECDDRSKENDFHPSPESRSSSSTFLILFSSLNVQSPGWLIALAFFVSGEIAIKVARFSIIVNHATLFE